MSGSQPKPLSCLRRLSPRLGDWPFALKMGLLPGLSVVTLIGTVSIAASSLNREAHLVDRVVQQDLAVALQLSESATRLQRVDAGLYRLVALQAARSLDQPVNAGIDALLGTLDGVLAD